MHIWLPYLGRGVVGRPEPSPSSDYWGVFTGALDSGAITQKPERKVA